MGIIYYYFKNKRVFYFFRDSTYIVPQEATDNMSYFLLRGVNDGNDSGNDKRGPDTSPSFSSTLTALSLPPFDLFYLVGVLHIDEKRKRVTQILLLPQRDMCSSEGQDWSEALKLACEISDLELFLIRRKKIFEIKIKIKLKTSRVNWSSLFVGFQSSYYLLSL
jgi:hypothetical protein